MEVPVDILVDRAKACLVGGAIGDALGAPVEFLRLPEIRAQFGPNGIQELHDYSWGLGAFTDDTQMTLFSCRGNHSSKGQRGELHRLATLSCGPRLSKMAPHSGKVVQPSGDNA